MKDDDACAQARESSTASALSQKLHLGGTLHWPGVDLTSGRRPVSRSANPWAATRPTAPSDSMKRLLTGEWFIDRTSARRRRILHYWATIIWLTVGLGAWIVLRDALWFVGFMSLYAIWITHIAGWAAETPVETESESDQAAASESPMGQEALAEAEPS